MRCKICDVKLNNSELLRKDVEGNHMDTCNKCIGAIYENTDEFDFILDVNSVLDNEEEEV